MSSSLTFFLHLETIGERQARQILAVRLHIKPTIATALSHFTAACMLFLTQISITPGKGLSSTVFDPEQRKSSTSRP
jgi:hypothetical protein